MCKSRLLFNDMPVFHENLFKIRCNRVISGKKTVKFLSPSLFCYEEPVLCRRTELQSGFYGRAPWDSLCYRVFVQSLVCINKNSP